MRQRKREFKGTPEAFRELGRIEDAARKLAKEHLDQPYKAIRKAGYTDLEIAYAFISLGYYILRARRSPKAALDAFDTLAHFGMLRTEKGLKRNALRRSKLH